MKSAFLRTSAVVVVLFTLTSSPLFADMVTMPKQNVRFGHEMTAVVTYSSSVGEYEIVQAQQSQDGDLALQISTQASAIGLPTPTPPLDIDLRSHFDLQPGVYSLTVESVGYAEFSETLAFEVRDSNFEIVPALTGSWFDPEEPGHGLNIEVFDDGRMVAYWYAYDDQGENVWLVADGAYVGATAELTVNSAEGQFFPPDYDPDSHALIPWGTLTFEFDSCSSGDLSWSPSQTGYSPGQTRLVRLSPSNGLACFDNDTTSNELVISNLFSEDAEEEIRIFNGTSVDNPGAENWGATFTELPESLGTGTALLVTPNKADREIMLTREVPGFRELVTDAFEAGKTLTFAVQTELEIAIPRTQLCLDGGGIDRIRAFFSWPEPGVTNQASFGSRIVFPAENVTRLTIGELPVVVNADLCEAGPDFIVRTFRTSGFETIGSSMDVVSLNLQMNGLNEFEGAPEGFFLTRFEVNIRPVN